MVSYILLLLFSQWASFTFCGDPNLQEEQIALEYAQAYQTMYLDGNASDPKAEKDSSVVEQDPQVGT